MCKSTQLQVVATLCHLPPYYHLLTSHKINLRYAAIYTKAHKDLFDTMDQFNF